MECYDTTGIAITYKFKNGKFSEVKIEDDHKG